MRTLILLVFSLALAYVGSYAAFRWTHTDGNPAARTVTVLYPANQPIVFRIFQPLAEADANWNGTVSKLAAH